MLRFGSIGLLTFFFSACTTSYSENKPGGDGGRQSFPSVFKGVWVVTDYIKDVERTKSPMRSSEKLSGVATLVFSEKMQADSLTVNASWNNHEGYSFSVYLKPAGQKNSLRTNIRDYKEPSNYYELGCEASGGDTSIFLYHFNQSKKLLDKRQFTMVCDSVPNDDLAWGIQKIVNEKIFAGNHSMISWSNSSSDVTFKTDGSITGGLVAYEVLTDFIGPSSFDYVTLYWWKFSESLAFEVKGDTIYLYTTKGDDEQEPGRLGQLQYRLVRR